MFRSFIIIFFLCTLALGLYSQAPTVYTLDQFNYQLPMKASNADIDGDGDLDIITQISYVQLAWYENIDGVLQSTPQFINLPANIDEIITADLDSDGDLDFLIHSFGTDFLGWIENVNGDASLFAMHYIVFDLYDTGPSDVRPVDVDSDGDIDIVAIVEASEICWYENSGDIDPVFTFHFISTPATSPNLIRSADFDNDGDNDIVVSTSSGILLYFENFGGGVFPAAGTNIGNFLNLNDIEIIDLENDGDLDMVFASGKKYVDDDEAILLFINNGDGDFEEIDTIYSERDILSLEITNFNGDEFLDIYAISEATTFDYNGYADNVFIFLNEGEANFSDYIIPLFGYSPLNYIPDVNVTTAADLNNDGFADLFAAGTGTKFISYNSGFEDSLFTDFVETVRVRAGFFSLLPITADTTKKNEILATDLKGRLSIYAYDSIEDTIPFIKKIDSIGRELYYSTTSSTLVFDLDNDGDDDIIVISKYGEHPMYLYKNIDGLGNYEAPINFGEYYCANPKIGDIDGDGFLDIATADIISVWIGYDYDGFDIYEDRYKFYWMKNIAGSGSFSVHFLPTDYYHSESIPILTDYDGDGDVDWFTYNSSENNVYYFENTDGLGTFAVKQILFSNPNLLFFDFFDEDKDGDSDLIYNTNDSLNVMKNDGTGNFSLPEFRSSEAKVRAPERFVFTDVNKDDFLDLICGTTTTQIFINVPGSGLYTAPQVMSFNYTKYCANDINNDSVPEILGIYLTNTAYVRKITVPETYIQVLHSNTERLLDENNTKSDTISFKMDRIPVENCYITFYQTEIPPGEYEIDCAGGTGDSVIFVFYPDSSALNWQYLVIHAIDDDENDDTEQGLLNLFTHSETGTMDLMISNEILYQIEDNDEPIADDFNVFVSTLDTIISEGTAGTLITIQLIENAEYPVVFTIDPDLQLDLGNGADAPLVFSITGIENKVVYIDAVDDNDIEGDHSGSLVISLSSEDDNFDMAPEQFLSFDIIDNDYLLESPMNDQDNNIFTAFYSASEDKLIVEYYLQDRNYIFSVNDINGIKMIKPTEIFKEGSTILFCSGWATGIYFVNLFDENYHHIKSIPVQVNKL